MAARCKNIELGREIFMEQPQRYISKEYPNHVLWLKKALYGLKQAPHAWFGKISQYLLFCGFKSSCVHPSLFVKKTPTLCTLLLFYVDDMIITGDDNAEINNFQYDFSVRFEMRNLGEASCFLGLEIKKCDGYFVSKKRYAARLLQLFRIEESRAKITPMEPHHKLVKKRKVVRRCDTFSTNCW
ncbi:Retrovirus-related Pol polyprotein from transposon TNT 1-94 [Gossypium australe]|uniref:Retrovirus-related Pol polyprotein from transposon TNT 1-94 n=1 Tax=Gossypium australe TaxID=47621 RepID=A0A5B6V9V4_9ROSI|nr:Retrovirus-related Pol polyprotein from transposon TNT 1-94 [Gossypium australe]